MSLDGWGGCQEPWDDVEDNCAPGFPGEQNEDKEKRIRGQRALIAEPSYKYRYRKEYNIFPPDESAF